MTENIKQEKMRSIVNETLVAYHALERAIEIVRAETKGDDWIESLDRLNGVGYDALSGLTNAFSFLDNGTLTMLNELAEEED